jgi:hypothetical protein
MKGKARDSVGFSGHNAVWERETWGSLGSLGEWRSGLGKLKELGNWGREEGKQGKEEGNW